MELENKEKERKPRMPGLPEPTETESMFDHYQRFGAALYKRSYHIITNRKHYSPKQIFEHQEDMKEYKNISSLINGFIKQGIVTIAKEQKDAFEKGIMDDIRTKKSTMGDIIASVKGGDTFDENDKK